MYVSKFLAIFQAKNWGHAKFDTSFNWERSNRNRETYYSAHVLHIALESRHWGFSTQYMGDDDDTFDAEPASLIDCIQTNT